ncbi:MAG: hypothetical protein HY660_16565 [Armatimonadetes bacterium]|nr:hypothetical protein [Armatimonadota bacterium]
MSVVARQRTVVAREAPSRADGAARWSAGVRRRATSPADVWAAICDRFLDDRRLGLLKVGLIALVLLAMALLEVVP